MLGIWLSQALDVRQLDGVASLVIAGLLASVAWLLARECRSLLTGEAASPELRRSVADVAPSRTGVLAIMEMATLHLGPELLLVTLSLEFGNGLTHRRSRMLCEPSNIASVAAIRASDAFLLRLTRGSPMSAVWR